jgi:hypothetical protein
MENLTNSVKRFVTPNKPSITSSITNSTPTRSLSLKGFDAKSAIQFTPLNSGRNSFLTKHPIEVDSPLSPNNDSPLLKKQKSNPTSSKVTVNNNDQTSRAQININLDEVVRLTNDVNESKSQLKKVLIICYLLLFLIFHFSFFNCSDIKKISKSRI